MEFEIRKEKLEEFKTVENVVREAFWNVYEPGCHEHLILHNLRNAPNYIADLSDIITVKGKIIGQILFSKAHLTHTETGEKVEIATFGPVSILPAYQKKGYGEALIRQGLEKATEMGYSHIVIFGNPAYYHKFGFTSAVHAGVLIDGQQLNQEFDFVMIKNLTGTDTISKSTGPWLYKDPEGFEVDAKELEEFDKNFPPKVKEKRPGQLG